MSDYEIEAAKRLLERANYRVLGPHEGQWRKPPCETCEQVARGTVDYARWTVDYICGDHDPSIRQVAPGDEVRDVMGLCSCGDPDGVMDFLREVLQAIKNWSDENRARTERASAPPALQSAQAIMQARPEIAAEALLQLIDAHDLLEHGSVVRYSWLSKKGEWALGKLAPNSTGGMAGEP